MIFYDRQRTASLLDFKALVDSIRVAAVECESGIISSPNRLVLPFGEGGVMLSMPATAPDVTIHKMANIQPSNSAIGLPTLHGVVTVCDTATGRPLVGLDGPEVTGRRTAAVSLLAIERLLPRLPSKILLIGTGALALYHLQALAALYPQCELIIRGSSAERSRAFCATHRTDHLHLRSDEESDKAGDVDVVIMVTTSKRPVWEEPAAVGRLLIGVGAFRPEMAEIGKRAIDDSVVCVDDPIGARHEAGDLMQAGIDWTQVISLASAIRTNADLTRPIVFKSVGNAAWDLAAARVALNSARLAVDLH
jgi:1-piperideine-2-carboxylate/1-pyrroline-2-carboxylate reductase [NAD(P)H]